MCTVAHCKFAMLGQSCSQGFSICLLSREQGEQIRESKSITKLGVGLCCRSMFDLLLDGCVCLYNRLHGHAAELACDLDKLQCMT